MCTSKAWEGGREGERERKLWFQIPSQDFFFLIVSVLQSKIKREGERERRIREEEAKLLLIRCPVLSVVSSHQEHPQSHDVGALEGKKRKNTLSAQGKFLIDYASRRQ